MAKWVLPIAAVTAALVAAVVWQRAPPSEHAPQTGEEARRIVDLAGRVVILKRPAQRIVIVRGRDIYEVALLLGDEIETRLVAWGSDIRTGDQDAFQAFTRRYPRLGTLPVIGDIQKGTVSAEELLTLQPDLVVVDGYMRHGCANAIEQLERVGLPLLYIDAATDPLSGPQRSLVVLGQALGCEPRAREAAAFVDAEIRTVSSRLAAIERLPPKVCLECGAEGAGVYGCTYGRAPGGQTDSWGTFLTHLPCRNIAAQAVGVMTPIQPDYLIQSDPDVIIITGGGAGRLAGTRCVWVSGRSARTAGSG